MLLYRVGPEGLYAAREREDEELRFLYSDPFAVLPGAWEFGRPAGDGSRGVLAPVLPGKIVGIGRNYRAHAEELGNEVPDEPLIFLKAPSSVIGPLRPILLPPESERVEFEGEIAVIVRHRLTRATREEAGAAVFGVTAAVDVTARDLQRRDATFARAKSFDTFCPLGPAILTRPDLESLDLVTRVNGEVRQRGRTGEMIWGIVDLLVYVSRMMTLEAGDIVLTGTPSGVGPLSHGDTIEVEISGIDPLISPVEVRSE